jgi:hypothetical protein
MNQKEKQMNEFTRQVKFYPAYDKRNSDPKKNYGIHGVDMRFLLTGEKGVIQFVIFTNWYLPNVKEEFEAKRQFSQYNAFTPMPADVGYHSYTPMYEGQNVASESCEYLGGKPCYYDGSGLYAETVFDVLVKDGDEAVWKLLEESYYDHFGKQEDTNGK